MQVLARLNTPVPTPISDNELTTRGFVETWELPVVSRITFAFPGIGMDAAVGTQQQTGTVSITLDKPAPNDCYVQWWRTRPASNVGITHGTQYGVSPSERRGVAGWRPLGWGQASPQGPPHFGWKQGNAADMPDIWIPPGTTTVALGTLTRLFRPPAKNGYGSNTYSRYYNEVPPAQWNLELPAWMWNRVYRNATKAVFKIGVMRRWHDAANLFQLERGPMSIETLVIQRWRFNQHFGARTSGGTPAVWALKVDVV